MSQLHVAWVIAALCAAALLVQLALRLLRAAGARHRARARVLRAGAAEHAAEDLLELAGYAVEARQVTTTWTITAEGEPCEIPLRADLIVSRDGRRFVAEVKTGARAPSLASAPTRRQLLEYRVAYAPEVDGVLLVDMEREAIAEVDFDLDRIQQRQ